jgi:hypothetical protein
MKIKAWFTDVLNEIRTTPKVNSYRIIPRRKWVEVIVISMH